MRTQGATRDLELVLGFNGILLIFLAFAMGVPALVDLSRDDPNGTVFFVSMLLTGFAGGALWLAVRPSDNVRLSARGGFVLTTTAWVSASLFGAIPFMLSDLRLDFADAFFEAMSGLTTTGATILGGLDTMHPGILLWRAILQWVGGIGIIVMALAVLPALRVGGMQLFHTESSDRTEKFLPKIRQVTAAIVSTYTILTALAMVTYLALGMSGFDAVVHAMTSISTGGFSTHDASFGFFAGTPALLWAATLFMFLSALPLSLYAATVARQEFGSLFHDEQIKAFLLICVLATGVATALQIAVAGRPAFESLTHAAFNVVSVITTTGYASEDYETWGSLATGLFFVLYFTGGCSGSTSGGIKAFRLVILWRSLHGIVRLMAHPHRVVRIRYSSRTVPPEVTTSIMGFVFVYFATILALTLALAACGLDLAAALSSAATAVSNVGPGLGPDVGPATTFASIPDAAKWIMALGMLLGRLELFTALALLHPAFWRD